ncbi:hypothetical protein [Vulcanisaeta sp. JCM 16161]|uniref:hypothetical protein n=1 Tax=Vulcanisaeta sp. JCM 16161 TaxID=1295372 RepID=UPI001FB1F3AB|nr:hypothetical protein [Vulcanisaeta sp. JCM 16161]
MGIYWCFLDACLEPNAVRGWRAHSLAARSPTINDLTMCLIALLRALSTMYTNCTDLIDHLSIAYLSQFGIGSVVAY